MQSKRCPDTPALMKIVEFRNPETARYAAERYDQTMIGLKLHKEPAAIKMGQNLHQFAEALEKEQPSMGAAMSGSADALKSGKQLYRDNLAQAAQQAMGDVKSKSINMLYGISDNSEILRLYGFDGEKTDSSVDEKIDLLFNAWLGSNDLLVRDGVIYVADEEGEPKLDGSGTPMRADAQALRELFEDAEKGLSKSLEKKGLNLKTEVYPYPDAQPTADVKSQEKISEVASLETLEPNVQPETGMGRQGG